MSSNPTDTMAYNTTTPRSLFLAQSFLMSRPQTRTIIKHVAMRLTHYTVDLTPILPDLDTGTGYISALLLHKTTAAGALTVK